VRRDEGISRWLRDHRRAGSRRGARVGRAASGGGARRRRSPSGGRGLFSRRRAAQTRGMSEAATHAAIEAVARSSYGRLIAFLAARSGDVAGAEDALSDAIVAALQRWPVDGIPQKPEAWLLHAARNRAIDAARHRQVRENSAPHLQQ